MTDYDIRFEGRSLLINEKKVAEFAYPIGELVVIDERIIVQLSKPVGVIYNENIFAVDREGRQLWQVQSRRWPYDDSPYVGINAKGKTLVGVNSSGYCIKIDVATGRFVGELMFTH